MSFVWRKKFKRDSFRGINADTSGSSEKKRRRERTAELERAKRRRDERAVAKAQHEEEMALLARERARAEFQDWERKEEKFGFDQSKFRSLIRLRDGRAKPIDMLAKNLDCSDDDSGIETNEPCMVFKGLTVPELEELWDGIKMYLDMDESTETRIGFWEASLAVCNWELAEARRRVASDRARVRGEEPPVEIASEESGLLSSIESDVKGLLEGKSFEALEEMQENIELQMRCGAAKVVEYWEAVLEHLRIYKAKACLREIRASLLRKHLLHREQPVEAGQGVESARVIQPTEIGGDVQVAKDHRRDIAEIEIDESGNEPEEGLGSYSPKLLHGDEDEDAVDPEEDGAELGRKREAVLTEQQRRIEEAIIHAKVVAVPDDLELKAVKAMGAMEEGDAVFGAGAEVNMDSQMYWWHDKYRPRKPKYFNRVHTGYEWSKYNQTHYDHDNPPPKAVLGYKFNMFYPDLVDKSKAFGYTIEKDSISNETCLIRFHAEPLYEDIAFRIVNKEWEYSDKKGFKCAFERGILHVYFNFKRYRYRR